MHPKKQKFFALLRKPTEKAKRITICTVTPWAVKNFGKDRPISIFFSFTVAIYDELYRGRRHKNVHLSLNLLLHYLAKFNVAYIHPYSSNIQFKNGAKSIANRKHLREMVTFQTFFFVFVFHKNAFLTFFKYIFNVYYICAQKWNINPLDSLRSLGEYNNVL